MCCDQTGAVNRQQYALAWWVLLFITGLPVFCVASDEPVVIDLAATDVDTRALLESMLESARENPGSAEARGHLGMAYEMNGFADAALATYAQAETLDAGNFLWPYSRALLLGCDNISSPACSAVRVDYAAALDSIEKALAIDDAYVPAWLWRARWLTELDRLEEAAAAYRRAHKLGGEEAAASVGLARILLRQGRPGEAVALLEPLTSDNSYSEIFRVLGRAYQMLGRVEDARIANARGKHEHWLVWLDPLLAGQDRYFVSYGGRIARAENMLDSGHAAAALQELESLRTIQPDDPTLFRHIGTAYLRLGQRARARDVLRQGLALDPDDYHLNLVMAGLYREARMADRALEHMQRAIHAVPTRGGAHYLLGTILMDLGRYDAALSTFDTALQHGVKNPARVLYTAGTLEVMRQNWDDAALLFEQSVSIDAAFTDGHMALAGSRAQQGHFDEAHAAIGSATRLGAGAEELAMVRQHVTALEAAAEDAQ